MKKLAGLIIILAVLVLGGYYGMGVLTESAIRENIELINQSNGLSADFDQYHRGLFSSNGVIKWRLHIPERISKTADGTSQTVAAHDYQMDMPISIHHGPVMYVNHRLRFGMGSADSVFLFPAQYSKQFDEQFTQGSQKPQLDLSIFVNYFCKSTIDLSLPAFKLIAKDGAVFQWMGTESITTLSPHLDKINGHAHLNGVTFSKADSNFSVGKITTEYNLHKSPAGLYLGDARLSLPSMDLMVNDKKTFEMKDLSFGSRCNVEEQLFSTQLNLDIKTVLANEKSYGPGSFAMSIKNLDADVLAKLNQQASAIQNGTEAERQQAMLAMLPELPKLFSKGAELEISKCTLKLPEGTIDGNLLLALPAGASTNPFELMQKIKGNAKLTVPAALVKQLMQKTVLQQMSQQPEMQQALIQQLQGSNASANPLSQEQLATLQAEKQLAALEQNHLITLNGSDYAIEVVLEQGQFNVNGAPFDPSMLKF